VREKYFFWHAASGQEHDVAELHRTHIRRRRRRSHRNIYTYRERERERNRKIFVFIIDNNQLNLINYSFKISKI